MHFLHRVYLSFMQMLINASSIHIVKLGEPVKMLHCRGLLILYLRQRV